MCGIYGTSLKPGANKRVVLGKLKILGLYNIERGKDASGIYIGGDILKTVKEFDDFIEDTVLHNEFSGSVVLAHNRQGSVGYKKTIDEAHPFLINDNLVFTHNGTIKNTGDLCKKYGVEEKDFNVDTKLLGTLLYTEGTDVLTHYKGAAALAYTYIDDPDLLCLYHGQSKEYKHGLLQEERPLFYMITEEGIYYSSMRESLNAIKESTDEKVEILNYNTIFKIREGEFLLDDTVKIDREEANVTSYSTTTYDYDTDNWVNSGHGYHYFNGKNIPKGASKSSKNSILNASVGDTKNLRLILRESIPGKVFESAKDDFKIYNNKYIYFHMGRYWEAPRKMLNGPLYVKKGGHIGTIDDKQSDLLFFFRGVLLKDKKSYDEVIRLKNLMNIENFANDPGKFNFAMAISEFSQYAVTNIYTEAKDSCANEYFKSVWFKNTKDETNASFTPKYSGRNYVIKQGVLHEIKCSHREKCLLDSQYDVTTSLAKLMGENAKKNSETQGGSLVQTIPFPERKEQDVRWFFEKTYADLKEFMEKWGRDEFEALRRTVKEGLDRDFSIKDPLAVEVGEVIETIISESVKNKVTVGDYLDAGTKGDSKLLLKHYNEVLAEKNAELPVSLAVAVIPPLASVIPINLKEKTLSEKIIDMSDKLNEIEEAEIVDEEDDSNDQIDDIVENAIITFEELQVDAFELTTDEDNDYAQKIASILLTSVENTLSNLKEPLAEYKKKNLENRVNKIRDTKINMKNGSL